LANITRFDAIDSGEYGMTIQPVTNFGPSISHTAVSVPAVLTDTKIYRANILGPAPERPRRARCYRQSADPPLATQPDGTRVLQTIDDRLAPTSTVGNVIYATNTIKVGNNAGVHWVKIDEQNNVVIERAS
jgi:hypothetical protein